MTSKMNQDIIDKLRIFLEETGMTKNELARRTMINRMSITKWLSGKTGMSVLAANAVENFIEKHREETKK